MLDSRLGDILSIFHPASEDILKYLLSFLNQRAESFTNSQSYKTITFDLPNTRHCDQYASIFLGFLEEYRYNFWIKDVT